MDINDVSSNQILDQFRQENQPIREGEDPNELGRTAFLELMVAQLNNQNPLEPTDNQAFVAQLAQFSTVEGIDNLNDTADALTTQFNSQSALQASSLVGQSVIVEGNDTGLLLPNSVVSGYSEIPASAANLTLSIEDENGQLLERIQLDNRAEGPMSVRWDGYNLQLDGQIVDLDYSALNRQEFYVDENGDQVLDDAGNPIPIPYPPGEYKFKLDATIGGESQQLDMQMSSQVDSVTMSPSGQVTLNLAGGQRATMDEIRQILDV